MPDALINMLVNEYKVPPEQAQTFAKQILSGKGNDPDGLAQKAYGRRGDEEVRNLDAMRHQALRFTEIHKQIEGARRAGDPNPADGVSWNSPEEADWYKQVLEAHHQKVREDAARSMGRPGAAAEMALNTMDNQRQWANNFQPDGFNPTQMVGTSLVPIGRDEMAAYQKYAAGSFGEPRDVQVQSMPYDVGQAQVRSLGVPQPQNTYMGRR